MQGYILHTQKIKDEDLLVFILSKKKLLKTYRFYGLRHSNILNGYKIDFIIEENYKFLPRLRDVLHLGFEWIMNRQKMLIWQNFIKLLYTHLKDIEQCDHFYFDLLDNMTIRFTKQNPKRVIIDAYIKLLEFEGRLHKDFSCFLCDELIKDDRLILARAFLQAHIRCTIGANFDKNKLNYFYQNKNSSIFDDNDIDKIYNIIQEGL